MTCSIAEPRKLKTSDFGVDSSDFDGFVFTGKQWDEDEQLYYFNARWYDPETGRFITEDPVKDSMLWYAYVNNNPMGFIDPTGLYGQGPDAAYLDSLGASEEEIIEITGDTEYFEDHSMEAEVRKNFDYEKDVDLTKEEVVNYYKLMYKKIILDEKISDLETLNDSLAQKARNLLIKEYNEYFMSILVKQDDTALFPAGNKACNYMSILAAVQLISGKPIPRSMINELTSQLSEKKVLSGMFTRIGTKESSSRIFKNIPDYGTNNWWDVANGALDIMGLSNELYASFIPKNPIGSFLQTQGKTLLNGYGEHWILSQLNIRNGGSMLSWDSEFYPEIGLTEVLKDRPAPLFINRR